MKSKLIRFSFAFAIFIGLLNGRAIADWAATAGSGLTFFAFTCFTSKICPAHVNADSTGTEIMTQAAPGIIDAKTGGALLNAINAAIPVGNNLIGKVGIDQTTPGTTNAVSTTNLPTTVDTNSGNKSASTPRFVIATDQPNLTTALNVALAANQTVNVAQINAVTPLMGNGTTGTGSQRVTIASDNTAFQVKQTDGTTVVVTDPCQGSTKSYLPITLATAAVKVIATGVSAKKIYICAIDLTNNAADSVAVFEATTATTCATAAVAVFGAGTSVATAATGYNFSANGGISKGNGGFSIGQTSVNNNDLCIAQSAATQLTGGITYVTQ